MLRRLGGSSNSLWKPKNPHSLEYLKYLHGVLIKNEKVTENNKKVLVEALRAIAEILIWGDQNDSTVFDFFLERQMLAFFLQIMKQDSGSINVQLLQTLNILFENIRHETSLYFLLSNNQVNSIISHNFDFDNEEIMAYYISFLKTLSFKLNACTIHFFFSEQVSNEFPMLAEALKLYNSPESMVRIAVRNIVLNIVRVNDPTMLDYVKFAIKDYLCDLIDGLVVQAIELDTFVRSAENVLANRERLRDKVDDLIDILHYIGELLDVGPIAEKLSDLVINRFLVPLLLNSLGPRRQNSSVLLTPVSSLFLFSEFLMIVSHHETVQSFLSAFLFENCSISKTHWVRDSDHYVLCAFDTVDVPTQPRIFFDALLGAFDASNNDDYLSFYGLMLIYSMFQNRAEVGELLGAAKIPFMPSSRPQRSNTQGVEFGEEALPSSVAPLGTCDQRILEALLSVVAAAGKEDSRLRPITLELACLVLRQLLLIMDADQMHNTMLSTATRVRANLCERLGHFVLSENLFLEWFEDEYAEFEVNHIKLDIIGYEMLLPPCATALSGLPLHKRLPSGFEEKIRSMVQLYLHARKLEKDLLGEPETELPLSVTNEEAVTVGDCINLNNSDLLSCVVVLPKGEKQSRFLVTDRMQLILVEPDTKKAGWAIVRFVGLLQDTQISGDPSDSRALHVVVEGQPTRLKKRQAILSARFVFDDHIRCMAAKQRLTKGRQTARNLKLRAIADVLGVMVSEAASPRANPFRIIKGCAPGSVRKQMSSLPAPVSNSRNSLNSIPDDPDHNTGGIKHV